MTQDKVVLSNRRKTVVIAIASAGLVWFVFGHLCYFNLTFSPLPSRLVLKCPR